MPSLTPAGSGTPGLPFNVRPSGSHQTIDSLSQVNRVNNKILYEDPLDKKRRERQQRINSERAEMANLSDPFAHLGTSGNSRAI